MTAIAPTPLKQQPPATEALLGNYFVAAYPPFSCWLPSQTRAVEEVLAQPGPHKPLGIYIHIPFCQKKCDYCYYLSYVGASHDVVNQYLDALIQELTLYAQRPAIKGRPVSFVYFGGGTPSLLSSDQIRCLASGLQQLLPWDGVKEVTFECAPRSVSRELLESLLEIGVTRLSMGVQSFDDAVLRLNGRIHRAEDVVTAYKPIEAAGFNLVNLDLMTGLMGETAESWQESVRRILELSPDSVTIYQTEIPHNTALYRNLEAGGLAASPSGWEVKRHRLDFAFKELEQAGYTIVNGYAAVKDPVRHCFQYQQEMWSGGDMLGLGVASFSYLQGVHFQNHAALAKYEECVHRGDLPLRRALRLSAWDQLVREFILQLKTGHVCAQQFQNAFEADIAKIFAEPLASVIEEGFATCDQNGVRLTREGLLCVDHLVPRFYDPEFQTVRYT